ncbi:MAG: hypothetical protein EXS37_13655 [Opitutus sp.]|nr:hypothetical protein [Opitutus sp.]
MAPLPGGTPVLCARTFRGGGKSSGIVEQWDLESGTLIRALPAHGETVTRVQPAFEGTCAVSGSSDGMLQVWDLQRGACLRVIGEPKSSSLFPPNESMW